MPMPTGRRMGRPYKHPKDTRRKIAERYRMHHDNTARVLCAEYRISRHTLYMYFEEFRGRM